MPRTVNGTGHVLHIQIVGLFQVLPVHETGAPINRRLTALVLRLHIGLDMARRVMLGRRRDGFDVVEDFLDRDVRDRRRAAGARASVSLYRRTHSAAGERNFAASAVLRLPITLCASPSNTPFVLTAPERLLSSEPWHKSWRPLAP